MMNGNKYLWLIVLKFARKCHEFGEKYSFWELERRNIIWKILKDNEIRFKENHKIGWIFTDFLFICNEK